MKADSKLSLQDHLCFKLYVASRLIVQAYGNELRDLGLTYPKYLVLLCLDQKNGLTVGEIGQTLSLDSGTLSPLLKSLAKQKYLERRRLESDERTVRNFLTKEGRKASLKAQRVACQLFHETEMTESEFLNIRTFMDDFVQRSRKIVKTRKTVSSPRQYEPITNQRSPYATN